MRIDIGKYLAELLYENQTVNIPGLGGFVAEYKSAVIDHVQGKIHPPSTDLSFNKNRVIDDGILVNFIREKHSLTYSEAEQAIQEYVDHVKQILDQKDAVELPGVGKIYRDYEKNIQFLPKPNNFNVDTYSLPPVKFIPINRAEKQRPVANTKKTLIENKKTVKAPLTSTVSDWFQKGLPIISALSVLIVGLGIYFVFFNKDTEPLKNIRKVPASRYNVSPVDDVEEDGGDTGTIEGQLDEDQEEIIEEEDGQIIDTEGATAAPNTKFVVIIIGSFSNQANVQRLVKKIFDAGYNAHTEKKGNLTKVGVKEPYSKSSEADQLLKEIQDKFEPRAKITQR